MHHPKFASFRPLRPRPNPLLAAAPHRQPCLTPPRPPPPRHPPTPHSTALAFSGVPVTRPPTSSVSRRRFSSSGEAPITIGRIFAAACAQLEASVVEQPAEP